MNPDKELVYREYMMRENNTLHAPYGPEFAFYYAVRDGDLNKVKQINSCPFSDKEGLGKLSDNRMQNLKYHFVITAALLARYCIEGGMEHELAYSLSDLYIHEADRCTSPELISELHDRLSYDYARRMHALKKDRIYSKPVSKCIDYIYDHLHKRITLDELAVYTGLNAGYLSRNFKKETGNTVTEYIRLRKVDTAKNMLKYSEYLPSQIAAILAFPSQSYFIEIFRKSTGMTPKHYRDLCFRETELGSHHQQSK